MKRLLVLLGVISVGLAVVAPALAQQQHGGAGTQSQPSAPAPGGAMGGMGGGPMMGGMGGGPMSGGMCPMMGLMSGMMGGGMMPMMGMGSTTDQKMMGQMLEMRGDMMKAVGEVMIKHGKAMQGSSR